MGGVAGGGYVDGARAAAPQEKAAADEVGGVEAVDGQ